MGIELWVDFYAVREQEQSGLSCGLHNCGEKPQSHSQACVLPALVEQLSGPTSRPGFVRRFVGFLPHTLTRGKYLDSGVPHCS